MHSDEVWMHHYTQTLQLLTHKKKKKKKKKLKIKKK